MTARQAARGPVGRGARGRRASTQRLRVEGLEGRAVPAVNVFAQQVGTLLTLVGDAGANDIEVAHERISPTLLLDEVDVHLQLETRGEPHAEAVIDRIREHGYKVLDRG